MKKYTQHRLTDVVVTEAADVATALLPWRPLVFRPTLASASASEDSTSLDDEAIFAVLASLGLDVATVVRRDFVSRWRSLSDEVVSNSVVA